MKGKGEEIQIDRWPGNKKYWQRESPWRRRLTGTYSKGLEWYPDIEDSYEIVINIFTESRLESEIWKERIGVQGGS